MSEPSHDQPRRAWTVVSRIAAWLGGICLCGGLLAGFVNREVLDSHRFASTFNAVRHDDAVATAIGGAIAGAVLEARPDLIAVRPLLAPAATSLVSSSEFDGLVQSTIEQLHANIVHGERGFLVNLTDVGAVATTLIPLVAPSVSTALPPDLNVKLATISAPSFGAKVASWAHFCALLSWLLPLASAPAARGGDRRCRRSTTGLRTGRLGHHWCRRRSHRSRSGRNNRGGPWRR